jgi:alkylhydroperoxidase family enzyme
MDRRRYELATIGAARELRSTYCSLAHGAILEEAYFDTEEVVRIVSGDGASVLSEVDSGIVAFAAKVAADATSVTQDDIDRLRRLGLSDGEIFEVVLSAAARSFFAKVLDATGTLADALYNEMDPALRDALTAARPIAAG